MSVKKNPETRMNEIIEAAISLFLEKTFQETTIDDILQRTGLSKGGFYHYFKSKEEVLIAVIDRIVGEVVREAEQIAVHPELSAIRKLQLFIEKNYEMKLPKLELLKTLVKQKDSDLVLHRYYMKAWESYVSPLASIVRQGVQEGSMHVEYPEETVRILYKALTFVHDTEPKLLQGRQQIYRHLVSLEQMIKRTLGMDNNASFGLATDEVVDALNKMIEDRLRG